MASYNELNALIDAYINRNGVQAITGQILNGVLKAMVEQLGRGYTIMGAATPTTDPGTPDGPESWFASTPGTYTNMGGLQIVPGELALLCYTPSDGWTKATIYEGFQGVGATIDGNVGTPSVGVSYANGVLSFDFHNMKGTQGVPGPTGPAAGFGIPTATVDGNVGTPGVSVSASGPDTAKVFSFAFTNLKGDQGDQGIQGPEGPEGPTGPAGVTSVVATVDNTTGNPSCTVSLNAGVLTLAFTGLKGAQGDTGSSVAYPFTIVNNLTTDDATQALSAAMGVQLEGEINQLELEVDDLNQELNGTSIPFVPQWQRTGYYISPTGSLVAYASWNISYPFILKKGQTVEVKTQGSGVCIIAATIDGTTYTPLVSAPSGASGLQTYSFSAVNDVSIALCVKWGLGDVQMRTYMVDIRSSVYDLLSEWDTDGVPTTLTATQSVSSGSRLNKSISLASYVGQVAQIKVTKTGGTTNSYRILDNTASSSVGSAFEYGKDYRFIITNALSSITLYGTSTESSAADFSATVEIIPKYGIENLDKKMFYDEVDFSGELISGKYINTNYQTKGTPADLTGAACVTGAISEGDILVVAGKGPTQYVGLYAFYDASGNKILSSSSASASVANPTQIFAPIGAASFVYNTSPYSADDCVVKVRKVFVIADLKDRVDILSTRVDILSQMRWGGKTVVCFGDSLTEFTDPDGKRYSDHLADITGANIVNVGIGGTRLSCRAIPVASPTNSLEGYAALDIPSLINAVSTNDFDIVDAGAEWVRDNASDDNTPIIARLKAIDWTKVDAVTIFAGTNDWGGEANIGTSGEVNIRTVYGSINYIITTLLTAYPNVQIYWFTPIVRWYVPWTDENWGGTIQKAGRTLEQFVELVKGEVGKQLIPVCDMYHTIGWNKSNFGQYFYSTDGTHPTKGYINIGRKIASFINANRTF